MTEGRNRIPSDPLAFIQSCVRQRRILWTYHVNMRLRARSILRQTIVDATDTYEVIESNPGDKYLPSYLVRMVVAEEVFHVLFAIDLEEDNVRVVTAYRPSPDEWEADLRRRKEQ